MLYALPLVLSHTAAEPVIAPGCAGIVLMVIALVWAALVPHVLLAVTLNVPAVAPAAKSIVILAAPLPLMVAPVPEYVQLYVVAPGTAATLYAFAVVFSQGVADPVIAPGCAGVVLIAIAFVWAALVPHVLPAVTLSVPDVAPAANAIVMLAVPLPVIVLSVPEYDHV